MSEIAPSRPDSNGYISAEALAIAFSEPGAVVELRILGTPEGVLHGFYRDPRRLAIDAAAWSGRAKGVYVTLNPVAPALYERSPEKLSRCGSGEGVSDGDIVARRRLLFDFDGVRPAEVWTNCSTTDGEHAAALDLAARTRLTLIAEGWPAGALALADSGNGGHAIVAIDLPNDAAAAALVKDVLRTAAQRFDTPEVRVDQKVGNPSRISKVYGTLTMKGEATRERPHRIALLIEPLVPGVAVPAAMLAAFVLPAPKSPGRLAPLRPWAPPPRDLDAFLSTYGGPHLQGPRPWGPGARIWTFSVCPWRPEHTNSSAFVIQFSNGAVVAGCHHNSCAHETWTTLRDRLNPPRSSGLRTCRASALQRRT